MKNRLTIKSRKTGEEFNFWIPPNGGYVLLEYPGRPGTLGSQIVFASGETLWSSIECFEGKCRKWYQRKMRQAVK